MKNIDYIEKLKYKHSSNLIGQVKTIEEIKLYIEKKFEIKFIDKFTKNKYFNLIKMTEFNCLNSIKGVNLTESDLVFNIFEVVENEVSSIYYRDLNDNMRLNQSVCIVLEMTTGYIESNSDVLRRELYLYKGVSKYDIDNNTPDLITYLLILEESSN